MRFATLFAFMLSLAALAAATSYPRPFDSTFTDAIDRFITASVDANSSISIIYDDFGASQGSQERALYDDVRVVSSVCQIALRAVASIYTTVQSNNTILETDLFYLAAATRSGQIILANLNTRVSPEDFCQNLDTNLDLNKLQSNIFSALDGIDRMYQAANDIVGEAPFGVIQRR